MDSLSSVVFGSLIHPMAALMSLPRFLDCFCLAGAEFNSHVEKDLSPVSLSNSLKDTLS